MTQDIHNDDANKRRFASLDEDTLREIHTQSDKASHLKKVPPLKQQRLRGTYGIDNLDLGNNMLDDIARDEL